jgi:hypothetical protein
MAKTGRPKTHLEPYSIKSLVLADSYWITRADLIRQILIDALERNFQDNITN